MTIGDVEASLLRRFLSEYILFGILGRGTVEIYNRVLPWIQEEGAFGAICFFAVISLIVVLCGLYNPLNYFFDIKIKFQNNGWLSYVWRSSARNALRSLVFMVSAILLILNETPVLNMYGSQGSNISNSPASYFVGGFLILYLLDKLGAMRFSRLTLLDQILDTRHVRA